MRYVSELKNKDLSGEVCLLRVDLNIDPEQARYSPRISSIIPTIRFFTERNAKVVLLSHRGRPKGFDQKRLSLRPFAKILAVKLRSRVYFFPTFDFARLRKKIDSLEAGGIILAENLRFVTGEERNSSSFAKQLAEVGTLYVNEAFAVSHRADASVVAVVKFLPSYAGLLLEQEIRNLSAVMRRPRKPLVVISGGAKVLTKIGLIRNFLKSADLFLVGGAMANTFLKAAGEDIGDSLWEKASLAEAKRLLRTGKIVIPVDTAMKGGQILDIGKRTRKLFAQRLTGAKTVIWNGPLGYIEDDRFARGTRYVIRCVAASQAFSVVGGGETVELIEKMGFTKKFGFVSTGGGAMLEFLSGRKLPGIEALNSSIVR